MPKLLREERTLLDIFSDYYPQVMGNGQIRMECPFRDNHKDGSGRMSFFISPEINAYHCFAGETRIPTDSGTFRIKDLSGMTAKVLTANGKFSRAMFKSYGFKRIWELHLKRDGVTKTIRTTSKHRWYIHGTKLIFTTDQLRIGQYLETIDFVEPIERRQSLDGIKHGIVFGDGTLDKNRKTIKALVNLHGVKKELSRFFSPKENKGIHYINTEKEYSRIYNVQGGELLKALPLLSSELSYLRGFLAGYISTEGCITEKGILILSSSKVSNLEFCRQAFFRLGISTSTIQVQFRKGYSDVDSPMYKITINTRNLDPSFFIRSDQKRRFLKHKKRYERNRWRITNIVQTAFVEEVYCAEVPHFHCFSLEDNILTGNCFSCKEKGSLIKLLTTRFGVGYFEASNMVRLTDYTPVKKEFDLDLIWDTSKYPDEFLSRGYLEKTLKHFHVGVTDEEEIVIPYYLDFNNPSELVGYQKRWYSPKRCVRNSKGFERRKYLYNLDYSKPYTILVEGQSDVWRLYQYGYNASALMGSDISLEQVEQLSKFKRIYLALDNDEAGRRGTEICYYFLKNHVDVFLIPYTSKDPGECPSCSEWKSFFDNSTDYLDYSMEMSLCWNYYLDMREEVLQEIKNRL